MSTISPKIDRTTFLCLLILFSFPGPVWSGGLAGKVQETYRATEQFRADFAQKTAVEVLGRDVEERGEIFFAKPGRFLIHYQGDRERKYISDGKTLWIYYPREDEVEVYENLSEVVSREALVFLGGLGEMTREFKVQEKGKEELVLTPKNRRAPFSKVVLGIDPETHLAVRATIFSRTGNESRYEFSGTRANEPVPDSFFRFRDKKVKKIRPPQPS